jgi:replication factor C subunit 2/4
MEKIRGAPNYKIILLDEADHLTKDAQNALRRIIEDFTEETRFCLICNYVTKIIEPLNSRCMKFRFLDIDQEEQINRLKTICSNEGISTSSPVLAKVVDIAEGDLRKSLNLLQMANTIKLDSMELCESDIDFISDKYPGKDIYKDVVEEYIFIENQRNKKNSNVEERKMNFVEKLIQDGVTAHQIIQSLYKNLDQQNLSPSQKAQTILCLTEAEENVLLGVLDNSVISLLLSQMELISSGAN